MRRMYSENQLVNVLENKDVVAKTLKQTEANYRTDISTVGGLTSGFSGEIVYGRVEEINNILFIVFSIKVKNESESTKTLDNFYVDIDLREDIAKKIIDFDNISVDKSTSTASIMGVPYIRGNQNFPQALNTASNGQLSNTSTANRMRLTFFNLSGSINAGDTMIFSLRTFLTLL